MRLLRLQLRFLLPLTVTLVVAAAVVVPLMDRLTLHWFARDLTIRGELVARTLSDSINDAVSEGKSSRLQSLFERAVQDERLVAIALCSSNDVVVRSSAGYPRSLACARAREVAGTAEPKLVVGAGAVHVGWYPVNPTMRDTDSLVVLHDLSFIDRRSLDTRRYLIAFIAALGLAIALITVVMAQLSWRGWMAGLRAVLHGRNILLPVLPARELEPLEREVRARLRDLEDELHRRHGPAVEWNPEQLRALLNSQMRGDQVIVVANREPYIHERSAQGIVVRHPASGLVTAVEPVMRACSGTWIAHGSGSADREVVDRHDRVSVPPGAPAYALRRVWLTPQEEQGYYYGFANEGLWPLCHVAHVRPVFRDQDWEQYREVNERFARAVVEEARDDNPVVLVQDYHFALLPAMIRARLPRATIVTFWHIPWPNPESFGICPWRKELLQGLLGSTIVGFHTQFHSRNFIESVDRFLEARIEHEHSTISYRESETFVASYPISIEWPTPQVAASWPPVAECRRRVLERFSLDADICLAVGVDRFDYTKGILERIKAVERLLEKHPEMRGRFVLLQVAAPSRSTLDEYRAFQERIHEVTERVNRRFTGTGPAPILLVDEHYEQPQVFELFRAADICVVTSLHDGMNLVSKEFVAARDDEAGVLVLSRFAGAARELKEALIVNPYHVEGTADALHRAATMPVSEQRERMASLRMAVRENNVYRWAGTMLADAARWRLRERIEARVRSYGESADLTV